MQQQISYLWSFDSFKRAFSSLVALSDSTLSQLAKIDYPSRMSGDELENLGIKSSAALDAVEALRTVLLVERADAASVLDAISDLADDELNQSIEANRDQLITVITPTRAFARARHERAVSTAIFPTLSASRIATDLRLDEDPNMGRSALLPLVSIRFEFDEPVGGGSHAVSFQVTGETLAELIEDLQAASDELDSAAEILERFSKE